MPITKRPCSNCPFRKDGKGIPLEDGRLSGIVSDLSSDDRKTFICHKTLDIKNKTCAGAVAIMSKKGMLPIIARLALVTGAISKEDISASEKIVINLEDL